MNITKIYCNRGCIGVPDKIVIVSEEVYMKIVEELGYEPPTLVKSRLLPDENVAYIFDKEKIKTPFFTGYKPIMYFNTDDRIRPYYLTSDILDNTI